MKISKELLKGSTALMVLRVIAEEDMYGYRIIREIEERSKNVFHMSEGSLYPILHAMEKDGLLESDRQISEIGKERKYYRITAKGRLMEDVASACGANASAIVSSDLFLYCRMPGTVWGLDDTLTIYVDGEKIYYTNWCSGAGRVQGDGVFVIPAFLSSAPVRETEGINGRFDLSEVHLVLTDEAGTVLYDETLIYEEEER